MNARYNKEVRVLWPMFGVSLAAIIGASWLFNGSDAAGIVMAVFAGACALIGAASFGAEFQSRTMLQLLAQPVSRRRLWFEKMLPLGTALVFAYLIFLLIVHVMINGEGKPLDFGEFAGATGFMAACAFFSVPALTLMGRNFIAGAVFAVILPLTLVGLFIGSFTLIFYLVPDAKTGLEHWLDSHQGFGHFLDFIINHHPNLGLAMPGVIYCAVLYLAGWRVFQGFQAVDGQTQAAQIKLPEKIQPALAALANKLLPRYSGPVASLVRKELQLHGLSFFLALLFLILFPLAAMNWKLHPTEVTVGCFWALFATYMIAIPISVGVMSMAEERGWGTVAWQLTLPASLRLQAAIKLSVTLVTIIFLGLLLPALVLDAGRMCFNLPEHGVFANRATNFFELSHYALAYLLCVAIIAFSSSLSTNSIRTITLAAALSAGCGVAGFVGVSLTNWLVRLQFLSGHQQVPEDFVPVALTLAGVCLLLLLCVMMFLNYQKAEIVRRRQFVFSGVFLTAFGTVIFLIQVAIQLQWHR